MLYASQWVTIFTWKNENWKSWKTCSQYAQYKRIFCSHKKFKQALNNWLVLKKVHGVISIQSKSFPKIIHWYEYRAKKNTKSDFEKHFFKLINNAVFGKTMENVRNHRGIKLITT